MKDHKYDNSCIVTQEMLKMQLLAKVQKGVFSGFSAILGPLMCVLEPLTCQRSQVSQIVYSDTGSVKNAN